MRIKSNLFLYFPFVLVSRKQSRSDEPITDGKTGGFIRDQCAIKQNRTEGIEKWDYLQAVGVCRSV